MQKEVACKYLLVVIWAPLAVTTNKDAAVNLQVHYARYYRRGDENKTTSPDDFMTYIEFNNFCAGLPSTTHVVQWGNSDVWKVGGKVFAIGGWQKTELEKSGRLAFSFKTSPLNFDILKDEPGFRPAPYLASRGFKWIQLYDAHTKSDEELRYYLSESHRLVSLGLSKKKQKELGLDQHKSHGEKNE